MENEIDKATEPLRHMLLRVAQHRQFAAESANKNGKAFTYAREPWETIADTVLALAELMKAKA
jgi:hypothetical protein